MNLWASPRRSSSWPFWHFWMEVSQCRCLQTDNSSARVGNASCHGVYLDMFRWVKDCPILGEEEGAEGVKVVAMRPLAEPRIIDE